MGQKNYTEQMKGELEEKFRDIREDMINDIKSVGKELALDIVSLNKKIDHRTNIELERMRRVEMALGKFEQRTQKMLKQYNQVHHLMRKLEGNIIPAERNAVMASSSNNEKGGYVRRSRSRVSLRNRTIESNGRKAENAVH